MKKMILMIMALSMTLLLANDKVNIEEKFNDCEKSDYNACNFVADDFLFQKKHMEANFFYSKAKDLMIKECDNSDYTACYNLGFNFELGSPAYPKNKETAMKYYNKMLDHNIKSCEKGNVNACFKLGLDYSDKGLLFNQEKSNKYFSKACEKGNDTACAKLK